MSKSLVRLGEIVDFVGGGTPSRDIDTYWNGDIPWASVKDFKGQSISATKEAISAEGLANSSSTIIPAGHIIIPTRMALGKAAINLVDIAINQDLKALKPKVVFSEHYLMHALLAKSEDIQSLGKGATVKGITIDQLSQIEIPLPPLEEQRRIAAILDKAANLDLLARVSTNAQAALNEAIFWEMFGSPAEHQGSWPVAPLGEVARLENGDRSSNYPSGDDIKDEGIPFLSTKNIVDNRLNLASLAYVTPEKFGSLTQGKARKGDLLITLRGTLGSCCIFSCSHETAFINAQMMLIRPGDRLLPSFLHSLLTTTAFQAKLQSLGYGAAVRQLSSGQLSGLPIPVPPISLQEEFRRRLGRALEVSSTCNKRHQEIKELVSSLQSQAFCGRKPI